MGVTLWGGGPAPLPDLSTAVLAIAVGTVGGTLAIALFLRFGHLLVTSGAIAGLSYLVGVFVLGIESIVVRDLTTLAHLWTTFGGLFVFALVSGSSTDMWFDDTDDRS